MAALQKDPKHLMLAVLAMGGQGGGVLVDWVVDLAERQGWTASATSVAGVAQRTGATIYYIELVEPTPGREPVLALMPIPGHVDVVIAAELMEAGRAVERGLVTPERTTLIASTHRTFSVSEKIAPSNGVLDGQAVYQVLQKAAKVCVLHDFQALAAQQGSVISASLFGALSGSDTLPFAKSEFETVVREGGVGVERSLKAFETAYTLAKSSVTYTDDVMVSQSASTTTSMPEWVQASSMETPARVLPETAQVNDPQVRALVERIRCDFAPDTWNWLGEGVARLIDWQDVRYAQSYVDAVALIAAHDDGADQHALTVEAARWMAVAMSYDDVIRVADLKTRAERHARLRSEVNASTGDVVGSEEFFHPRLEEVQGLLPVILARAIDKRPGLKTWLDKKLNKGRRIESLTVRGYLMLRMAANLRGTRLKSQRHAEEMAHIQGWLALVQSLLPQQRALALEVLRCRRLVKGYSDTHSRGLSRFDRLMDAARTWQGQPDAAQRLAALRQAALQDASGAALRKQWLAQGLPADDAPRVQAG